jgi:hypothetical protein
MQSIRPLVSVPREQYLRKEEARIRSLSLPTVCADSLAAIHLTALEYAEELQDCHEVAATSNRQATNREHMAVAHDSYAAMALQLKLYHLNQLSAIVL